jgi:hypothetical protein
MVDVKLVCKKGATSFTVTRLSSETQENSLLGNAAHAGKAKLNKHSGQ